MKWVFGVIGVAVIATVLMISAGCAETEYSGDDNVSVTTTCQKQYFA